MAFFHGSRLCCSTAVIIPLCCHLIEGLSCRIQHGIILGIGLPAPDDAVAILWIKLAEIFELGLTVPEVASVSEHKDVRMLFRYTHPMRDQVIQMLDAANVQDSVSCAGPNDFRERTVFQA